MKKIFFLAATAALALSSCSSDEELVQSPDLNGDVAVSFDNYLQRSGRGTHITTTASVKNEGFGVFAYDHAQAPVETYTNSYIAPNFFSNEKVTFGTPAADRWGYSNTKYWPNNPGNMLSFYAYAPYSDKLSTEYGVSNPRLILNGDYNGPALYYKLPETLSEGVDLCWGAEYGLDKAPVNKTKPAISTDIKFNLKHALSRYGFNVQVFSDNMTDNFNSETTHRPGGANNNPLTQNTSIYITSLKLVGNFCTEGTLSLYDGKWDCDIANTAEYELKSQFNPLITDEDGIALAQAKGELPLFKEVDDYVMLLPDSRFKILIEYDVVTKDPNLLNGESRTKNVILSEEEFTSVAGVATDFHLNLGMTTVKFDAVVTDWNNANMVEIDLPNNTLEVVNYAELKEYSTLPLSLGTDFLGRSKSVMKAEAAGKYYFNTEVGKLYKSTQETTDDPIKWTVAPEGNYLANTLIYTRPGEDGGWSYSVAPRWIKVTTATDKVYLLDPANGKYTELAVTDKSTTLSDVKDLAKENPAGEGVYILGDGKYYYYKHQPTNNFGQN